MLIVGMTKAQQIRELLQRIKAAAEMINDAPGNAKAKAD